MHVQELILQHQQIDVNVLVHSPTHIWLAMLKSWLNPTLHPQIVKVEWSAVCEAMQPMLLDRSAPAAAYAMPRAAPRGCAHKRTVEKGPPPWRKESLGGKPFCLPSHAASAARVGAEFSEKETGRRGWPRVGGRRAAGPAKAAACGGDSGA